MHDIVIIGGGPAGMTAAIYGARKELDQVMISPDVGGQAAWASDVENYLGYTMISGFDLVTKFEEHVKEWHVPVMDDRVTSVERREDGAFETRLEGGDLYISKVVLVASGRSARNLGVPGEERLKGRGVAYCATCDGPLFKGEDVAVVGGGNAGLNAAVQLLKIAKTVYVIEELPKFTGDATMRDKVYGAENGRALTETEVLEITGNPTVDGVRVRNTATRTEEHIALTGVFIEIGSLPNTGFVPRDCRLTSKGEIEIDCGNNTSVPGLFAAGDVTSIGHKQIIIAAGEGAKALLAANDYLVRKW